MAKRMAKSLPKKRELEKAKALRRQKTSALLRVGVLLSSLSVVFTCLIYFSYQFLDKPLDSVKLNARFERVSTLDVEKVLANYKHTKFLSVDLETLKNELQQVSWVDVAEVKRSFPKSLLITITEHVAAARWGNAGLLNTRGELILKQARYLPPELPQLNGPEGSEWQVAQKYLEMRKTVLEFGLNIETFGMDARGAWSFALSNGTQVEIGREATDQRFYRFAKRVLPLLFTLEKNASVVDMRYSNGFAVKWQKIENIKALEPSEKMSEIWEHNFILGETDYA